MFVCIKDIGIEGIIDELTEKVRKTLFFRFLKPKGKKGKKSKEISCNLGIRFGMNTNGFDQLT